MNLPAKPRYRFVFDCLYRFFTGLEKDKLPFNPSAYIGERLWNLISYTSHIEVANRAGIAVPRPIAAGITVYLGGEYTVFYDEKQPPRRINFTLAHEIAHIYLNHLTDFNYGALSRRLTDCEYTVLEKEADVFAKNILAPLHLVEQMDLGIQDIYSLFNISIQAAINRYRTLDDDFKYISYRQFTCIKKQHTGFINKYINFKKCDFCGYLLLKEGYFFCPVCRAKTGAKSQSDNFSMIYGSLEQNSNMRLKKCPVCENEKLGAEDFFCKICGVEIINRCASSNSCGRELLDANARYCPVCGEKTIFFNKNILVEWSIERGFMAFPKNKV